MKNILFIFLILLSVACSRQWPGQLTDTDMAPYADIAVTESARGFDRNALVDGDPLTYWTSPAELTNPIILFLLYQALQVGINYNFLIEILTIPLFGGDVIKL